MSLAGRPRVLDETKRREICAMVSAGCGLDAAARYVSCSVSTIRREALRNGLFRQELRASELRAQLDPLRAMRQAASTHWRAAAWLLERTNPRQFARQKPDACGPKELHDAIDAVVEKAVEEIADPETRDRVCRQLLATAYRATRAVSSEERRRLDPRVGVFELPLSGDERRLNKLMEDIELSRRQHAKSACQKNQNPARSA
jgi:IS30 family transposase